MGYYMDLKSIDVRIKDSAAALQALKDMPTEKYSWVNIEEVREQPTLQAALDEWRWDGVESGGFYDLESFTGEKLGSDKEMFDALAPFIEPGGYVEMQGEDGAQWRWVFDGKTCKEVTAAVIWCRQDALDYLAEHPGEP